MSVIKKRIIYSALFVAVFFNNFFQSVFPFCAYFDELILFFSFGYLLFHIPKKINFKSETTIIVIATFVILSVGIIANVLFEFHKNTTVVIKDIVAFMKFPITIVVFSKFSDRNDLKIALDISYLGSKIIIVFMSVFALISFAYDIGMSADIRHGIKSYKFIYSHPTYLAHYVVMLICCLTAYGINRKNIKYHILGLLLLLLSMRDKAFAFVFVYFIIVIFVPNIKKIKLRYILLAFIGAFIISKDKIKLYMNYSWSPRMGLYTVGIQILKRCFPIGSGFGTFASNLSGEYYSKLYYIYKFNKKIGTSPENYVDLGDAGLPYYYGQFGMIGTVCFIIIVVCTYKLVLRKYGNNKNQRIAAFLLLAYSVIAILVENFFVNETGATIAIIMFVFLGNSRACSKKEIQFKHYTGEYINVSK